VKLRIGFICILVSLLLYVSSQAQRLPPNEKTTQPHASFSVLPPPSAAWHDVGNMRLCVQNNGIIGKNYADDFYDCFTGIRIDHACEFPAHSEIDYLYTMALWVGAIVGTDTLVSTGSKYPIDTWGWGKEFFPDPPPGGDMVFRSTVADEPELREGAISEQDFIAVYTDTFIGQSRDYFLGRHHRPLGLEVTQKSYAWSYPFAEDFVLFDLQIENIGSKRLEDVYVGIYLHADPGLRGAPEVDSAFGDVCGFLKTAPSWQGCGFEDILNLAWEADNDGDPFRGEFLDHIVWSGDAPHKSVLGVAAAMKLRAPTDYCHMSYNWWTHSFYHDADFGPRRKANFRDFRTGGLGTPEGDVNKYYLMRSGEIDYDKAYTSTISPLDPVWMYPGEIAATRVPVRGYLESVLSYGPVTLTPGSVMPFAFAYIVGDNFHTDPDNLQKYLPFEPNGYYANVDFSDLAKNAMWARWMYDNPGFDTDGDGYYGKFRVCVHDSVESDTGWIASSADTFWYEGDGIPDWRGATPPPAPPFWVTPTVNGFHIRFNGSRSETERDVFSNLIDFEGYNIYLARDDRESSYSLMASYDIDDYDKYVWDETIEPANYVLQDIPFTLERLRCLYGAGDDPCSDASFKPHRYTQGNPYRHPEFPDSMFYFLPHHYNASELGVTSPIRKMYPDEPDPATLPLDSLTPDRYTEEGFPKYYEYEFTIENLLPTVPYWINVTVFDFGSPAAGLNPLETSKTVDAQTAYVFSSDQQALGQQAQVYVYPNPYRKDGEYRIHGYEGRTEEHLPNEKVRAIHFANLPAKCTIRIYTIDGDRVRTIHHDFAPDDPWAHHDEWNMVTRNRNAVMSGLYYWTVEDEFGHVQMGKLVIIM
jgi:hypothetical protein